MSWDRHLGRRVKLRDLYILMAVVKARGMGKAAEQLNMSQPAVSNAIADLERAIGVRLLDRSRRGVEPTPYGRALINRGNAVFDELRQGIKDIEFLADPRAGELRIGTSEDLASGPVLAVVKRLSQKYPRIVFHVVTRLEPSVLGVLTERTVELVIVRLTRAEIDERLRVENLFNDSFAVAAGMHNPFTRRRRKIELADLVNEPWALFPFDVFPGNIVADAFRASGIEPPRTTVITQSRNMRNRLVATSRFLTVVPSFSLRPPSSNPGIRALPVELPGTQQPVAMITLKNRALSPLAQLFMENVRTIAKPLGKRS
jgi:DNA-binding transcriptional LysR family regulator